MEARTAWPLSRCACHGEAENKKFKRGNKRKDVSASCILKSIFVHSWLSEGCGQSGERRFKIVSLQLLFLILSLYILLLLLIDPAANSVSHAQRI